MGRSDRTPKQCLEFHTRYGHGLLLPGVPPRDLLLRNPTRLYSQNSVWKFILAYVDFLAFLI